MRPTQPSPIPSPIKLCVHCGFTVGEFQARRLLGCPHCYSSLGDALLAEFLVLHPALGTSSRGSSAWPSSDEGAELAAADASALPQLLAAWRERLNDAVRREDYAEAAALKARIDAAARSGQAEP